MASNPARDNRQLDHRTSQCGFHDSPHRLVVRTSRCGRDNPGSTIVVDIYLSAHPLHIAILHKQFAANTSAGLRSPHLWIQILMPLAPGPGNWASRLTPRSAMACLIPLVCHVWRLLCALPLFQRGCSPRAPRRLPEECPHEAAQPPMGFLRAPRPFPQECSRPCHEAYLHPCDLNPRAWR